MKFELIIETTDAEFATNVVSQHLMEVARRVLTGRTDGAIRDLSGATIGRYQLDQGKVT